MVIVLFRTTKLTLVTHNKVKQKKVHSKKKNNHLKCNNLKMYLVLIAVVVHSHVFCLDGTRGHLLRNSAPEIRKKISNVQS